MNIVEQLKNYGAMVKEDENKKLEVTFYHDELTEEQFRKISKVNVISLLVFYYSLIDDEIFLLFGKSTSIKNLGLISCNNITDKSINTISMLPSLEQVSILDTKITAQGKKELKMMRPEIEIS
jgi:hypothetical protein